MWTCGTHSNRLFVANVKEGTVTMMELNECSYGFYYHIPFKCPTALFGGSIIGIRIKEQGFRYVKPELINISTNQVLQDCPKNRNLQQICSEQFLIYIMEMYETDDYLLLCIHGNAFEIRKATFSYYPYGLHNDIRMIVDDNKKHLYVHTVSNEVNNPLTVLFQSTKLSLQSRT
jgi:hypothetical protein